MGKKGHSTHYDKGNYIPEMEAWFLMKFKNPDIWIFLIISITLAKSVFCLGI